MQHSPLQLWATNPVMPFPEYHIHSSWQRRAKKVRYLPVPGLGIAMDHGYLLVLMPSIALQLKWLFSFFLPVCVTDSNHALHLLFAKAAKSFHPLSYL